MDPCRPTSVEDFDFADDLALLAHTHAQMQAKTTKLEAISSKLGLKINSDNTKTIRINSNASEQITINNLGIEDVTSFTYLVSVIKITGRADEAVLARIRKARSAFNTLTSIWRSREISTITKIRIFNSWTSSSLLIQQRTVSCSGSFWSCLPINFKLKVAEFCLSDYLPIFLFPFLVIILRNF